jgi:hypothetical protein
MTASGKLIHLANKTRKEYPQIVWGTGVTTKKPSGTPKQSWHEAMEIHTTSGGGSGSRYRAGFRVLVEVWNKGRASTAPSYLV